MIKQRNSIDDESNHNRTLLLVNTAAQLSVGPSVKCITVALIGKSPIDGASTLTNVPLAVPTANPAGNLPAANIYFSYSSLVAKSGRIKSVSPSFVDATPRC